MKLLGTPKVRTIVKQFAVALRYLLCSPLIKQSSRFC